jgi:tetratricopeptide (TPR) repeat protein
VYSRIRRPAHVCAAFAITSLAISASPGVAQTAPPAGTLQLANRPAEARDAFLAGLDATHNWSWKVADDLFAKTLALDSTFGLARILRAEGRNGPTPAIVAEEFRRGLSDASGRPIPEQTFALAHRAVAPNSGRLFAAARTMLPADRRVALDHALALAGNTRLDSLRAVAARYADFAAPRMWLAYYLTLNQYVIADEAGKEALATAEGAVRIAPGLAGAHTALGHVLHRLGRYDEALAHLRQATTLEPTDAYAYELESEIFMRDGKTRNIERARAAIDSARRYTTNITRSSDLRRTAATLVMHEGRIADAAAEQILLSKEAEAAGALAYASTTRARLAVLLAGARDYTAMDVQLAEARRISPNNTALPELEMLAYAVALRPDDARRARTAYTAAMADSNAASQRANMIATRALIFVADKKPAEALAECKTTPPDGGFNLWCDYVAIEANLLLGNRKEADALRTAYLARRNLENLSMGFAITAFRKTRVM